MIIYLILIQIIFRADSRLANERRGYKLTYLHVEIVSIFLKQAGYQYLTQTGDGK